MAEHLTRNEKVVGSIPTISSSTKIPITAPSPPHGGGGTAMGVSSLSARHRSGRSQAEEAAGAGRRPDRGASPLRRQLKKPGKDGMIRMSSRGDIPGRPARPQTYRRGMTV